MKSGRKSILLQVWTVLKVCRSLRLSEFLKKTVNEDGKEVSPTHWPTLTQPQKIPLVLIPARVCVAPKTIVRSEGLSR